NEKGTRLGALSAMLTALSAVGSRYVGRPASACRRLVSDVVGESPEGLPPVLTIRHKPGRVYPLPHRSRPRKNRDNHRCPVIVSVVRDRHIPVSGEWSLVAWRPVHLLWRLDCLLDVVDGDALVD